MSGKKNRNKGNTKGGNDRIGKEEGRSEVSEKGQRGRLEWDLTLAANHLPLDSETATDIIKSLAKRVEPLIAGFQQQANKNVVSNSLNFLTGC